MPSALYNDEFKKSVLDKYSNLEDIKQFPALLNYIDDYISNNEDRKKITLKNLYFLVSSKDTRYKTSTIPKKNGKCRVIDAPDIPLKRIQKLINILLQVLFEKKVHYNSNGFLLNRGIVRNATTHIGKRYLLNLDIKDFFPTITFRRIKVVLSLNPFNLKDEREKIAFLIANLSTYNGILPQGAPTSPILSNIVTQNLDRKVTAFCKSKRIRYSRYADDLSFSSNENIFDENLVTDLIKIVESENFKINAEKTRLRTNGERQEVTGIIVNKKLNINRHFLKKTRAILNNWEKKGNMYTQDRFLKYYNKPDKGDIDFKNVLWGYISFIGLIRGKNDKIFFNLFYKYLSLKNRIDYSFISNDEVKLRLVNDNLNMEKLYCENLLTKKNVFIDFCTIAFHQVENLLYYFYWKRFPNIRNLSEFLYDNNPEVKKRSKKGTHYYGKIGDVQINHLVYLFEKEFYFDKKISYNKEITFLRNARNDSSHRCLMNKIDILGVKSEYEKIKEHNKKYYSQHKKNRPLTETEIKTELNYRFIMFMEQQDYNKVRDILVKIASQIESHTDVIGRL